MNPQIRLWTLIIAGLSLMGCTQPGQISMVSSDTLEGLVSESTTGSDYDDDPLWQEDLPPIVNTDADENTDDEESSNEDSSPIAGFADCAGYYEWRGDPKEGGNEDFGSMDIHVDENGQVTGTFFSDYHGSFPLVGSCYTNSKAPHTAILDVQVKFTQDFGYPFKATIIPGPITMMAGYMNLLFNTGIFKGIKK